MAVTDDAEADWTCSFCGKPPLDVEMMMGSPIKNALICNECIYIGMVFLARDNSVDFNALVDAAKKDRDIHLPEAHR